MLTEPPDWELEAQRISAALGMETGKFKENTDFLATYVRRPAFEPRYLTFRRDGIKLEIVYNDSERWFTVDKDAPDFDVYEGDYLGSTVVLTYDGMGYRIYNVGQYASELARMLFKLDLLLPEIEAGLGISAHEKLEWMVEREERLKQSSSL